MQKMLILLSISSFLCHFNVNATWFNGEDIDYWQENKKIHTDNKTKNDLIPYHEGSIIRVKDNEPFDWNNYNDPSKIEFYDDGGNFVPNRPWREVMKNPTHENVEKYMAWQAKKISLSNNVGKMMAENSGLPVPLVDQPKLNLKNSVTTNSMTAMKDEEHNILWDRLQVLYFYRSKCHFCQASKPNVSFLKDHHVLFIPVQLDWKENPPIYSESVKYDQNLAKIYNIRGTPSWIIKRADKLSSQIPLTIEGYVSIDEMEKAIKSLF